MIHFPQQAFRSVLRFSYLNINCMNFARDLIPALDHVACI